MDEKEPNQSGITNKNELMTRLNLLLVSSAAGGLFGGLSYGLASIFTDRFLAERIGLGVGGTLLMGGLGATNSNISLDRAEDYLEQGRNGEARLQVARAILEGAAGYGAAGGLIGIEAGNSINSLIIGSAIGIFLGASGTFIQYRERVRPFPNLIIPDGNSTQRDLSFPDRQGGTKFPPVFRASTLRDFKEFREINKERIVRWALSIPSESEDPTSLAASRLVTSIAVIPNIRHFPAFDPKKDGTMKLVDEITDDNLIVDPCKDAFLLWPYRTSFESMVAGNRTFEQKLWNKWRDISWRHDVVLLAQYQTSSKLDDRAPEKASDHYWLLDVVSDKGDHRRRARRRSPEDNKALILNPVPNHI